MLDLQQPRLFRTQCYIDGAWCDADSGATDTVTNPFTRTALGTVPAMGATETRRAIEAAQRALPAWRAKTAQQRSAILRRWFELVLEHQEDLARIMTAEQGKPITEARSEITYGASFLEWFSEEAKRVYGDTMPAKSNDTRVVVLKEPIGVCAAITPWNFPSAMITKKAGPALAAGCTMVLKPAPDTPYSALAMVELAIEAGVPRGVLSVVTGAATEVGGELTSNSIVRKLTFTGSTATGRLLMRQCADTVKKVSLELGGNAPLIVFDDADIDVAVQGTMQSKFRNMGQTCTCANRIFVQDGVYDAFAAKMEKAVAELKVGDGFEPGVQQGPLINDAAIKKVEAHIADAIAKGARITVGGKRHALGGTFFEPTVLTGVTSDMIIARQETFGPVAPLFRFHTEEEVIYLANDTEYGLAAYFYGRDIGRVWRVAEALEFGLVGVNASMIASESTPFGGVKQSGIGREGSKYGLEEFLEIKYVCMGGI